MSLRKADPRRQELVRRIVAGHPETKWDSEALQRLHDELEAWGSRTTTLIKNLDDIKRACQLIGRWSVPLPMSSIRTSYWCEFARSRRRCVSPEFKKFSSVGGEQTMPPGVATARGRRLGAPE